MEIKRIGDGPYIASIIGGLHGDEVSGVKAIDHLYEELDSSDLNAGVKLILANEKAYDNNVRYIDKDLNRCFMQYRGDCYEQKISDRLEEETATTYNLSLHSTVATETPMAIICENDYLSMAIASRLPVEYIVDVSKFRGMYSSNSGNVEVEAGLKGEESTVENAIHISKQFLDILGITDKNVKYKPADEYEIYGNIPKENTPSKLLAENFKEINQGEFISSNPDVIARENFTPILLSKNGYEEILGYKSSYKGRIRPEDYPFTSPVCTK